MQTYIRENGISSAIGDGPKDCCHLLQHDITIRTKLVLLEYISLFAIINIMDRHLYDPHINHTSVSEITENVLIKIR